MIAQGFGFTRDFLKERNNSAYFRLKKIPCGFKEQARARHPGEICGLALLRLGWPMVNINLQRRRCIQVDIALRKRDDNAGSLHFAIDGLV